MKPKPGRSGRSSDSNALPGVARPTRRQPKRLTMLVDALCPKNRVSSARQPQQHVIPRSPESQDNPRFLFLRRSDPAELIEHSGEQVEEGF